MIDQVAIDVMVFVFGAIIGSFLNVCIVRMPKGESIVKPRSHCAVCKKTIPWYDNIPLFSYLLLGGRCRSCRSLFSFRYFLVELLTGLAFLGFSKYYGLTPVTLSYFFMLSCFIVATFVDFEHRIIPDEVSVGGMCVGFLLSCFIPELHQLSDQALVVGQLSMRIIVLACLVVHSLDFLLHKRTPDREDKILFFLIIGLLILQWAGMMFLEKIAPSAKIWPYIRSADASLIGLLFGGGMIYAMGLIGDVIFRKESMGGGDVKLVALMGAFLGWKVAFLTFFLAPFAGAIYGIAEKIRTKDSAIAYGPFLVLGCLVSMFYGDQIITWILGQYGIYNPSL